MNFNRDSIRTITLSDFNRRVDRAIECLQTKELTQIADSDHINIMMCLNTILMTSLKEKGPLISQTPNGQVKMYATIDRFTNGRYKQLEDIADQKNYDRNIVKVYPDWVFSRGMGLYFVKLQMELYGTPHLYAFFQVSD